MKGMPGVQELVRALFAALLKLYPNRFRREFSAEVEDVFAERMREAQRRGGLAWIGVALREILALAASILREGWHELRTRKEAEMDGEDRLDQDAGAEPGGGRAPVPFFIRPAGGPNLVWIAGWALLTTAALPTALVAAAPLAAALTWLLNLGAKAGLWPAVQISSLAPIGFVIGLALELASVQWFLLRKFLPRAWLWFVATVGGVFAFSLAAWVLLSRISVQGWDPIWYLAMLLPLGLILGLAQWLYLRRFLPNAFWIIFLDVAATGSILLTGGVFSSLQQLIVFILPGTITGVGLWLMLMQYHFQTLDQVPVEPRREKEQRLPRLARAGLLLAALVPLFFACSWVYAASQLALAKNYGVYATPEEGMRALVQKPDPTDRHVKILYAGPNSFDGSQSYIWYVIAEVRESSPAEGSEMGPSECSAPGSFFIETKQGWVHVPEGAFPGFIGFWMKVFGWAGEGQSTPSTEWAPDQPSRFCQ